jgi:hypothetical protein
MATFQSLWVGDALPPYQRLAMKSFIDFGHRYALYTYQRRDVPAGVELRDASAILPEARVFRYGPHAGAGRGSVAVFGNLFRYHLLHQTGDWWVDTDVICLSDTVPADEIYVGVEEDGLVGNAILKFPAGHGLVAQLRDVAEGAGQDVAWGATGPRLLTRVLQDHNLMHLAHPQPSAYPIQHLDALHLLIPARRDTVRERVRGAPFLHMWNEVFRRAVILPWVAPPAGSFIADLFTRHGIVTEGRASYTADQVERLNENYLACALWPTRQPEQGELVRLKTDLRDSEARADALAGQATSLADEVALRADESERLRGELRDVYSSRSWRVTWPLRRVMTFFQSRA